MKKIFSLFAAVLFAGSMFAAEAVMQYTGSTTANMVGDGANNAETVGLDADLFTVLADKGANQNLPGLNKAGDIRLYSDKTTGNGNTITVSIANGTINSIVLDIKQTATFVVKAGSTAVTEADGKYAIEASSFSIQNTTTGATTQLQLNKITITYTAGGEESDCKWDEIDWFNTGIAETDENFNQFKVCKAGDYPNFVNIQIAPWADNKKGIYIDFPTAEFTAISLDADQYKVQGAGILLFLTAFTEKETDVVITYKGDDCAFTIYNDKGTEPAAEEVELNITKGVMFTDAVEEEGWWQVRAMNDHYFITLSNAGEIAAVAGTYTAAQLDEDYSYVNDRTEEIGDEGYTDITFTEGSVTVTVAQDGKVSFVGALTGNDGKIYNINIVYTEPKPETTVNFTAEGEIEDYIESMNGFFVGALKDNVYVQVFIYSDQIAGEYTIEDLDPQYSYIQLGEDEYAEIYSATIKVVANADGSYTITADVLCYGDVLYKITVTIPGEEPTAIDNAKIADKIRKAIINGNVVIEKSNILYNVNGAIVR